MDNDREGKERPEDTNDLDRSNVQPEQAGRSDSVDRNIQFEEFSARTDNGRKNLRRPPNFRQPARNRYRYLLKQ